MGAYTGPFTVADGAAGWSLAADRLRVNRRGADIVEVVFDMSGLSEGARFELHGNAERDGAGRFVSPPLPVSYPDHGIENDAEAEIVFSHIMETADGYQISGEYWESKFGYRFEGLLEPLVGSAVR